jgi:hypothetical protein
MPLRFLRGSWRRLALTVAGLGGLGRAGEEGLFAEDLAPAVARHAQRDGGGTIELRDGRIVRDTRNRPASND